MEWSSATLRLMRVIAETGSFTAAAGSLHFTQSAVSRQVAALEQSVGTRLFDRHPGGATLTPQGWIMLRAASGALDAIDRAERVIHGTEPVQGIVRLGVNHSVGAALVPRVLAVLRDEHPAIEVVTRDATSRALTRSLRSGTIEVALIASLPPYAALDDLMPQLEIDVLLEGELMVAVAADSDAARVGEVTLEQLEAACWISSPRSGTDPVFGVWPALPSSPRITHVVHDWLAKLQLVGQGWGVTTVPPTLAALVPPDVRLVRVVGGTPVLRRAIVARQPGDISAATEHVVRALRDAAADLPVS
ncbi:LysR family transcriptional regulator [Allobranchiibius huperziae]|uniref:DNA-binding transcriptional LysR family regulator n=1 Tax=Allobranchiibius huperziae TaxID=1874116 RepID=A0A853DJL9_9MICO|nr:LysR family transcriptional regulator [Allobranchiibius huperziae]NYJ74910.1 DNA-binding transcriptional LysR family regulator [Allobranchiibius huperziae]